MTRWSLGEQMVRDHYFREILGLTAADDPEGYDRLQRDLDDAWAQGMGVREFCEKRQLARPVNGRTARLELALRYRP